MRTTQNAKMAEKNNQREKVMKKICLELRLFVIGLFAITYLGANGKIIALATEEVAVEENTAEEENAEKAEDSEDESAMNVALVEVSNYDITDGILAAGKDVSIVLTLHNLNREKDAHSVMLTISNEDGMIYPSYGNDNQTFVGQISAGETVDVTLPVTVSPQFTGDAIILDCQVDYVSEEEVLSNSSKIALMTFGGSKINIRSIDVGTNAIVNGKSLVSINYSNKSNANITDARIVVDGNVSDECKEIELGAIYAEKSYSKDLNVTFTQPGNQSINLKLVYTDGAGEHVETDLGKYSVTVSEETIVENKTDNTDDDILYWGGRGLAGVLLLIAVIMVVVYIRKR